METNQFKPMRKLIFSAKHLHCRYQNSQNEIEEYQNTSDDIENGLNIDDENECYLRGYN